MSTPAFQLNHSLALDTEEGFVRFAFIASHGFNALIAVTGATTSAALTFLLLNRKHNLYITTLIALATYGIFTCAESLALALYSSLMIYSVASGDYGGFLRLHSWQCTAVLSLCIFLIQMSFMAILATTVERLVALCNIHRSFHKSPLIMTFGLLVGSTISAAVTFGVLAQSPRVDGICDTPLRANPLVRQIVMSLYVGLIVGLATLISVLIWMTRKILRGYYINRALLTLRSRVSIDRTVRISKVQIVNLVITETVQVATLLGLYFGSSNPLKLSPLMLNSVMALAFYAPCSLFCLLTALNQFRLLRKETKPRNSTANRGPVSSPCCLEDRNDVAEMAVAGADEAQMRFLELEACWTSQFEEAERRKRIHSKIEAAEKKKTRRELEKRRLTKRSNLSMFS